jgi:hypothetical protein
MRYEIHIAECLGPLMTASLGVAPTTRLPPTTRLTAVRCEPTEVVQLVGQLGAYGLEIIGVRIRTIPRAEARTQRRETA